MRGFTPLILGILGTFAFSWIGLALIPDAQIGHLEPQSDEEGTDIYPMPKSGLVERGRQVYVANGCVYCHTQQVRADYAGSDIERKWGTRRSAPRDYIFDRPVLIGRMRIGPDLANVGKRAPVEEASPAPAGAVDPTAPAAAPGASPAAAQPQTGAASVAAASPAAATTASPAVTTPSLVPKGELLAYSAAWHHRHLYDPRSVNSYSIMPSFRFLYEKRRVTGERAADALQLDGVDAPGAGWEVVPTYEARSLVAFLMSLDQSHELKEVKSAPPASPPAPGSAAK